MIYTAFIFTVLYILLNIDFLLGNIGILPLLSGLFIFYISAVFGRLPALTAALCAGFCIDFIYGREFYASALIFIIFVIIGDLWIKRSFARFKLMLIIPGAIMVLIYYAPILLLEMELGGFDFRHLCFRTAGLIFSIILNSVCLVLIVFFCDICCSSLGIVNYNQKLDELPGRE